MNIQRGRGQVHAADAIEGYMPTPKCGGNRSAEGYSETEVQVTCKNCLKILAKEDATEQAPETMYTKANGTECQAWGGCANDRTAVHHFQGRDLCSYHSPFDVGAEAPSATEQAPEAPAALAESLRITEERDRLSASPWLTITGPFGAEELARTRRETEERDAARIKEAEHLTAPVQQRTGLLSDDDLYVNREAWKATSAAMDSVGKALADQARARTAAVETVMGLGSDALDALRYARETAARLRREAAERDIPNAWDLDTVYADNGEPMTFQNVRVPMDLVADYSGLQATTWRRGVNAAHRAAREEQGK